LREAERRRNLGRAGAEDQRAMLTKDLLFGMNIVSLAGFVVMFLALNLSRRPGVGKIWSIALMSAGTALLLVGLYLHTPSG
jgi:hypothetical protein